MSQLGWTSSEQRRKIDRLTLFYKGLNNLANLHFLSSLSKPTRILRHIHTEYFMPLLAKSVERCCKRLSPGFYILWNVIRNDLTRATVEDDISMYADDHQTFSSDHSIGRVVLREVTT